MRENNNVYNGEDDVVLLLEIIENAINLVEESYYNLKTTYEPDGIVRERVFCYELYHRMRQILEESGEIKLTLNGEIDKRSNIEFAKEDRKNPDFVFHIPGDMEGNTIVIEIKGQITGGYLNKCLKDFETIVCFVSKYKYKAGVFVLYNFSECPSKLVKKLQQKYEGILHNEISRNIFIICKEYGKATYKESLYDILCKR